jgi:hypothetical protein
MINFPCHCGHKFSVGEDMAGGMIQCPQCGRLNDVPLLSDLAHLSEDGTYNLELLPEKDESEVAAELQRIYHAGRVDDEGNEIDLRQTLDDIYASGIDQDIPTKETAAAEDPRRAAPKYDPMTGELIEPVNVLKPPVFEGTPSSKIVRPALAYGQAGEFALGLTPLTILLALFRPVNVIVMFFIFIGHALLASTLIIVMARALIVVVMVPGLILAIIAHYGNVVDETGPAGRDELPTPLRGVQWHDDLWGPFRDWMLALILCYGPAVALLFTSLPAKIVAPLALALAAVGTLAFPAALLTSLTSGTVLNLRPDRVFITMGKCGFHYVVLVFLWIVAAAIYAWGTLASVMAIVALLGFGGSTARMWFHPLLILPLLLTGIYLMHYFCWYLGLMYRAHHADFPWVFQRHHGKPKNRAQGFAVLPVRRERAQARSARSQSP